MFKFFLEISRLRNAINHSLESNEIKTEKTSINSNNFRYSEQKVVTKKTVTTRAIRAAITDFEKSIPSNLPVDKLDIFEEHVEYALDTFTLVKKLQKTEKEYNLFAQDYRDLHFSVRKKEKKIRKIEQRIEKLKAEIRNIDDDKLDT